MKRFIFLLLGVLFLQQACVPSRVADDLRTEKDSLKHALNKSEHQNDSLRKANDSLHNRLTSANKQLESLKEDTALMNSTIEKLRRLNKNLNDTYEKVISNKEEIITDKAKKSQELLNELNRMKENMEQQEKALMEQEKALTEQKNILHAKTRKLDSLRTNLKQRQKRVRELETALSRKDSTLSALKNTVSDALINLKSSGLSVEMKNSKVYISLEEKLLFESGKYQLDQEGKGALDKISQVLKENPDVNIMVEGHTDDQKVRPGSKMKDNWELSVLRSTEVVRYLTEEGGVNPERLIASGRGSNAPVVPNDSPENRKKNRRTELILTPQMDKLFDIFQTNQQ